MKERRPIRNIAGFRRYSDPAIVAWVSAGTITAAQRRYTRLKRRLMRAA